MQKEQIYNWQDTNVALFGSDIEIAVKKEASEQESAWNGLGQKEELRVWRINNFKVEPWPLEQYGSFYEGDSYIVYKAFKGQDQVLHMNIHFWIGKKSTQDEYGTAAYKVVELDTYLSDVPVQYREVQDYESQKFLSYFDHFTVMKGGVESGFNIVTPELYQPKMFVLRQEKNHISFREIEMSKNNLDQHCVYIIDLGLHLYILIGKDSHGAEAFKANNYYQKINNQRHGKVKLEIVDRQDDWTQSEIYKKLSDNERSISNLDRKSDQFSLFRLTDRNVPNQLQFIEVSSGPENIKKSDLDSDDVFILNTNTVCYIWIGKNSSIEEKRNCFYYSHNYLVKSGNPFLPIVAIREGHETSDFKKQVQGF